MRVLDVFFLRGLCLTEKPSQTHPFKRDQPSLCLSCRAGQPQKCVPLQGFRLQTVVVLVVFLYTKIELRRIVTRHVSGNHKACLNGKQSSSSSFQSISFFKLPRMWKSFQKINIFVNIRLASFWNRSISVLVVLCLSFVFIFKSSMLYLHCLTDAALTVKHDNPPGG